MLWCVAACCSVWQSLGAWQLNNTSRLPRDDLIIRVSSCVTCLWWYSIIVLMRMIWSWSNDENHMKMWSNDKNHMKMSHFHVILVTIIVIMRMRIMKNIYILLHACSATVRLLHSWAADMNHIWGQSHDNVTWMTKHMTKQTYLSLNWTTRNAMGMWHGPHMMKIIWHCVMPRGGGLGSSTIFKNLMSPTPRRKWYLTTRRRAH